MSIINISYSADAGYVSSDTQVSLRTADGPVLSDMNKLFVIPTARTVVAARGEQSLIRWLVGHYLESNDGLTFDSIVESADAVLTACWQALLDVAKAQGVDPESLEFQIEIVGYSDEHSMIRRLQLRRLSGDERWQIVRTPMPLVSPVHRADLSQMPAVEDHAAYHLATAAAQVEAIKAGDPMSPIGGQLVLAKITKEEVTVRNLGVIGVSSDARG